MSDRAHEPLERPSLKATGLGRRRLIFSRIAEGGAVGAAALAIGVLGVLVVSVFIRALPALSFHFFIEGPKFDEFGRLSGGIAPAIVGTFMLVVIASVIAVPIGVLTALWVSEFAPKRLGDQVKLYLDILNGFPSIVIGIFVYGLLVTSKVPILTFGGRPSAWAGGFALAIVMLPLISRTTMEVLSLVPNSLREASYALGVSKWRTVLQIILPTAIGGIMTGHDPRDRARGRRDRTAPLRVRGDDPDGHLESLAGRELDPVHDLQRLRPGGRTRRWRGGRPSP